MTDEDELDGPAPDAGRQHSVETAKKKAQRLERARDAALGALLEHRQGRALVWHWLAKCGVFQPSFAADSHLTAFKEGRRDIGLAWLADVTRVDPAAFAVMQREAAEDLSKP